MFTPTLWTFSSRMWTKKMLFFRLSLYPAYRSVNTRLFVKMTERIEKKRTYIQRWRDQNATTTKQSRPLLLIFQCLYKVIVIWLVQTPTTMPIVIRRVFRIYSVCRPVRCYCVLCTYPALSLLPVYYECMNEYANSYSTCSSGRTDDLLSFLANIWVAMLVEINAFDFYIRHEVLW